MGSQADDLRDLILQAGYSNDNIQRRLEELRDFMSEETALFFLAKELGLEVGSFSINSGVGEETEIDYDEFIMKVIGTVREYNAQIEAHMNIYWTVQHLLENNHRLFLYAIPPGAVGFYDLGKKQVGFLRED